MTNLHAVRSVRRVAGVFLLALAMGASGVLSDPVAVRAMVLPGSGPGGAMAWLDLGAKVAGATPLGALLQAIDGQNALDDGADNRLTILLLGSDTRTSGVSRTDSIMIFQLVGNSIRAASIPRDIGRILNPFTANASDTFKPRVNAILKSLKATYGSLDEGFERFKTVIEYELGMPPGTIDYHALITFNGFHNLVSHVAPIKVTISKTIKDTKYSDHPQSKGVYFPAAVNYELYGWQPNEASLLCDGDFKSYANPPASTWCHRALVYVRTRKGSGNSDFKRARRQQDFVLAAVKRVLQGNNSTDLDSLIASANVQKNASYLYTDIPLTVGNGLQLYNALANATATEGNQVVFAPPTYATHIPGGSAYQLKLTPVRNWVNTHFE